MRKIIILLQLVSILAVTLILPRLPEFDGITDTFYSIHEIANNAKWVLNSDNQDLQPSHVKNVIDKAKQAVVYVAIYEQVPAYKFRYNRRNRDYAEYTVKREIGSGTGFFITQDGYLLTNKHVVASIDAEYTVKISEDVELPAAVVYRDPEDDLAVLKVTGNNFTTLPLADSSETRVGDGVMAVGNAMGQYIDSIATGKILSLKRDIFVTNADGDAEKLNDVIQTSVKLYPGDSGGPLLDNKGNVVGIDVASQIGADVSFSIPIDEAKETIRQAGIAL